MTIQADTTALLGALYDEDEEMAELDLPPRTWRVTRGEAEDLVDFARARLDLAWRDVRQRARQERLADEERRANRRGAGALAATRDALLARLAALQAVHGPALQVAHRKLDAIGDEELRTLVADLEALAGADDDPADAAPAAPTDEGRG